MSEELLKRIADALERIAKVAENEERRTVNQNIPAHRRQKSIREAKELLKKETKNSLKK